MSTQQCPDASEDRANAAPDDCRLAIVSSWLLLAVVVSLLVLRAQSPGHPLAVAIVGLAPFGIVPAIAALVAALWSGGRILSLFAVATTLVFMATVAPHGFIGGCASTATDGSIGLLTANVKAGASNAADIALLIATHEPDVVLLQEVQRATLDALDSDKSLAAYVYRSNRISDAPVSVVMWSRWPIGSLELQHFSGVPLVHGEVSSPSGNFIVSGVHTTSPYQTGLVASWLDQFEVLAEIDTSIPRILAGDFNATADHLPFRRLLSNGWTDAYDERGCGLDATWPARGLPFAFYRLDHVLVTSHFQVDSLQIGELPGSDHKPVLVTIHLKSETP